MKKKKTLLDQRGGCDLTAFKYRGGLDYEPASEPLCVRERERERECSGTTAHISTLLDQRGVCDLTASTVSTTSINDVPPCVENHM
jgi:hypothetical protein